MPTWNGWIIQFLNAANLLNTPPNQTFMAEWAAQEGGSCARNPVDLATVVGKSTNCGSTVTSFGRTQNYATHADAATAFKLQMDTPQMKALRDALNTGNPFQISNRDPVVSALKQWGSTPFANWYKNANSDGTGGGGSTSGGTAAQTHKGWASVRHSFNVRFPAALKTSEKQRKRALRALARAHKVKL